MKPLEIKTFTQAELDEANSRIFTCLPIGVLPNTPYLIARVPGTIGGTEVAAIPLTELRDALAALPPPPGPRTVEEWNTRRREEIRAARGAQKVTGLICPACGEADLEDTQPGVLLMSNPAQKRLDCPACHHIAYILA